MLSRQKLIVYAAPLAIFLITGIVLTLVHFGLLKEVEKVGVQRSLVCSSLGVSFIFGALLGAANTMSQKGFVRIIIVSLALNSTILFVLVVSATL